jgi:DNA-binding NtrC family response regulator
MIKPVESAEKYTGSLPRVLVADDQRDVVRALRLLLRGEGFEVETVDSPSAVLEAIGESRFDVALIDLNYTRDTTSGREGLDLLEAIQQMDVELPVVVMTAWSTVELAVLAMRNGAADFVEKPWKNQRLLNILRNQTKLGTSLREQKRLKADRRQRHDDDCAPLVADSPDMQRILDIVERVAVADANVLLTGDNGTGKGLLARHVHSMSGRCDGPFVSVNMGGLAAGVFESEMFGHVKGAFTDAKTERLGRFEMAEGGTLFLDEIGNLPMDQQVKLLHALETGHVEPVGSSQSRAVNVRLIAATNSNLKQSVADGQFRKDLFFRLNTVEIHIPPLAERPEDIPTLAAQFLDRHSRKYDRPELKFSTEALAMLMTYSWPGNVRELNHVVERAVLLARGEQIQVPDLHLEPEGSPLQGQLPLMKIDDAEKLLIQTALGRYEGNVVKAARALGLSRSAFYRRLEKYGLDN